MFLYSSLLPASQLHAIYASHQAQYPTDLLPFKALSELSNRLFHGMSRDQQIPKTFYFHQDDLDKVLYGYARQPGHQHTSMHALSGLKVGDISHGKYQCTL